MFLNLSNRFISVIYYCIPKCWNEREGATCKFLTLSNAFDVDVLLLLKKSWI